MDIQQLKQVPLFANLTSEHLARIASIGTERTLKAGEVIFKEGDIGHELYAIISGKVRISKMIPGAGEEALAILEPGGYFGEMALIDGTPRSADAKAHIGCQLWVIQKADLDEAMFLNKDLAYELLWEFVRTLARRLRETNEKIKVFFTLSSGF